MKGYVKIEAINHNGKEGLSVETELEDVSYVDRFMVVHAAMNTVKMSKAELRLFNKLTQEGMFDSICSQERIRDDSAEASSSGEGLVKLLSDIIEMLKED